MAGSSWLSYRSTSIDSSRIGLRHEACILSFEHFRDASPPTLGDRLRNRIGEYLFFALFESVEVPLGRRFGRDLWYVEPAVHVSVNRTQKDAVDCHALTRQHRPQ